MKEGEPILLHDVQYALRDEEIYRLLGYRKGKAASKEEVQNVVDNMKQVSEELILPQGAYLLLNPDQVKGRGPFQAAEKVGLGLCTIGLVLENRVRELFEAGNYLEGLVLDTIGSVAVDSAADHMNFRMCEVGEGEDLTAHKRTSPGYGSWSLEGQALFFELLPNDKLGMELTPSFMMIPRKSISFAVKLMKDGEKAWKSSRCSRCGMLECPYRENVERGDG
jgi:cobalamin-dependent methionine synthase I